jgi:hypothetical protein
MPSSANLRVQRYKVGRELRMALVTIILPSKERKEAVAAR